MISARNIKKEDENPKKGIKTSIATIMSIDQKLYYDVIINWMMMI
jgi:hypothetical protein